MTTSIPPRVGVIGGGWYGCQIAHTLRTRGFDVVLFEKDSRLFEGASGKNQFRLHAGFHYPRSGVTRAQILAGLREFRERLPKFVQPLDKCLYAIAAEESMIDFDTFKQIFKATNVTFLEVHPQTYGITNVEGCVSTEEEMFFFVDTPRNFYSVRTGKTFASSNISHVQLYIIVSLALAPCLCNSQAPQHSFSTGGAPGMFAPWYAGEGVAKLERGWARNRFDQRRDF